MPWRLRKVVGKPQKMAASASATAAPPRFTIVSCVKSRPSLKSAADTALARAFLPSLVRTVTSDELRRWSLSLYLCADDTDMFYVRHAAAVRNLTTTLAPWLNLQLLFYPATKTRVPNVFLFTKAVITVTEVDGSTAIDPPLGDATTDGEHMVAGRPRCGR